MKMINLSPVTVPRVLALLAATLVLLATSLSPFVSPASGHVGNETVIFLDVFANGEIEGEVQHPAVLLSDEFGYELSYSGNSEEGIAETAEELFDFQRQHLSLATVDGVPLEFEMTDTELLETESGEYGVYNFEVLGEPVPSPRQFQLNYDGLFDRIDGHDAFVVIRTDFGGGTFNNEANFLAVLEEGSTSVDIDLDDSSIWKGFVGTVELGVEHILIGTDHILFVLVLLIPSVLVFSSARGWEPGTSFKSSFWRVLKIATSFTIAHSITLTLGGLGIIELPSKFVETLIALSIIAAAFHNLRPIFANKEWLVAFGFGLFHGLGFAGLLTDLGLGQGQRVLSLLGFNVGVEIGQMFIIALTFPILFIARRTTLYPWFVKIGSLLLALVAAIWAIERITENELGIDGLLMRFTSTPQVWALLLMALIGAIGLSRWQDGRGELLTVANGEPTNGDAADIDGDTRTKVGV